MVGSEPEAYKGTSPMKKRLPVGPYRRAICLSGLIQITCKKGHLKPELFFQALGGGGGGGGQLRCKEWGAPFKNQDGCIL